MRMPRIVLFVFTGLLCCWSLPTYWFYHQSMHERPERIYPVYARELDKYGQRLEAGTVRYVEGHGYAIPRFLIDKGAKRVVRQGDCFVVVFNTFLDNPAPELWYCPGGFDPLPAAAARVMADPKTRWHQLSARWAACYNP